MSYELEVGFQPSLGYDHVPSSVRVPLGFWSRSSNAEQCHYFSAKHSFTNVNKHDVTRGEYQLDVATVVYVVSFSEPKPSDHARVSF